MNVVLVSDEPVLAALARRPLEPLGVTHRRVGFQRSLARFQFGAPFLQLHEIALRFIQVLLGDGEGLIGSGEVPAELFVAALR